MALEGVYKPSLFRVLPNLELALDCASDEVFIWSQHHHDCSNMILLGCDVFERVLEGPSFKVVERESGLTPRYNDVVFEVNFQAFRPH